MKTTFLVAVDTDGSSDEWWANEMRLVLEGHAYRGVAVVPFDPAAVMEAVERFAEWCSHAGYFIGVASPDEGRARREANVQEARVKALLGLAVPPSPDPQPTAYQTSKPT